MPVKTLAAGPGERRPRGGTGTWTFAV